ncbi:MAG: GspE/PulE family protein [Planctomycetes bacterium]|nr:GspE/PulE family protein [Planctomycetota bacterium]MBU1518423.1 GspE/PulE family protein [Planctomycetota bacterium]MBU2458600.1 GspE/PulE family protein [Planctomycetota bacterium]MBU2595988.1 GspE/PulE family protein [Planctomycetota bacterium]
MPQLHTDNSLFDEIIRLGIADEQKLNELDGQCRKSGRNIITVLKEDGLLTDEQFSILIAKSQNIEFINLSPDMIEPIAAHMIPYELSNEHNLIGVRMDGDKLYVAMGSPMDLATRDQIEMRTGCKVIPQAAAPNAIKSAIRYHFNVQNVTKQTIASMRLKKTAEQEKQRPTAVLDQLQESEDPVSSLVASIIAGAIDSRVSDIHIEPQEKDMVIRYRIDGVLRKELNIPSSAQAEILSHIKILAKMDIAEKRLPQDGHITTVHHNKEYDLRVSSLPSIVGEKIVIRILDKTSSKWNIDNITPDSFDNQGMRRLVENPYGMILLTGPTGSGKTTTLYSLLQLLNNSKRNIVTVEDPVEYRLDGITQVQTNTRAGLTFASALRSILRQDPDVILIGEIRDLETAEIAVSAAMTGHLVLATLHTNDAAGAISRLINLGVPSFMLASSLLGAIAQRLVRTSCFACKETYTPEPEVKKLLFADKPEDMVLHRSTGCDNCAKTGYLGRKGIYEILPITSTIQDMIIAGKSDAEIKRQAIKEGMRTLKQSGIQQVLSGATTLEELYRVVDMQEE